MCGYCLECNWEKFVGIV